MRMLGIRRFVLDIEQLRKMPPGERSFFVLSGHAVNELLVLLGTIEAILNTPIDSATDREARETQTMVILRIVLGKLFESWQLIEKGYLGSPVGKKYSQKIPAHIVTAMDVLKKYYGSSNFLSRIRNNYAFHYSSVTAKDLPRELEASESDLAIYIGSIPRHSLFFISEAIIGRALLSELGTNTLAEASKIIWAEGSRIARATIEVLGGLAMEIYSDHSNATSSSAKFVEVGVLNPSMAADVTLPYFTIPEGFPLTGG